MKDARQEAMDAAVTLMAARIFRPAHVPALTRQYQASVSEVDDGTRRVIDRFIERIGGPIWKETVGKKYSKICV